MRFSFKQQNPLLVSSFKVNDHAIYIFLKLLLLILIIMERCVQLGINDIYSLHNLIN